MLGAVFSAQPSGSAQAAPPLTADYVPADAVLYIAIDTVLLSPEWIQTIALAQRISDGVDPAAVAGNLLEGAFQTDVDIDPVPFLGGEIGLVFIGAGSLIDNADPAETVLDPAASANASIDGLVIVAMPPSVEAAQVELTRALELEAADRGVEIENAQYRDTSIQFIPGDVANGLPGVAIVQAGDAMMVAASP